jgi:hypothetical protein
MDFEGALRARLLSAAPVVALVADWRDTKAIYWVDRPQASALPAITLQTIDDDRAQHMGGFQSMQRALVQVDIWAATYAAGKALKEAVIAALVPAASGNGIDFRRAFVRGRDLSEQTETQFVHRPSLDFTFFYSAQ